jgi:hypothetical protein
LPALWHFQTDSPALSYQEDGIEGLHSKSKRPGKTPEKKVTSQIEQWVLALRKRRLGT